MHNLSTVIRFEISRSLKKKSFWIMAIGFPMMMAAIFSIIYISNHATSEATQNLQKERFSIEITDESGLITPGVIRAVNATTVNKEQGLRDIKAGHTDAYFYYPTHITRDTIEVYGKEAGMFDNGKYDSVARALLQQSVNSQIPTDIRAVVQNTVKTSSTYYKDGVQYDGIKEMILPGVFLVLFYLLISFFGNQMLVSTTEEKENRVIEMILTTIQARTLIIGKIISLVCLAIIQGVVIMLPALIGYLFFHSALNLPFVDLTSLPIDPGRILLSFALFGASFMMFTGLLVTVGSAVPTAKEAGQFFGIVMMLIFGPLYAASLFVSAPESTLVRFLSFFPLTAPIPLMLRNALGSLTLREGLLGLSILTVSAIIIITISVRVFRYGALEYSRKLHIREFFSK